MCPSLGMSPTYRIGKTKPRQDVIEIRVDERSLAGVPREDLGVGHTKLCALETGATPGLPWVTLVMSVPEFA